MAPSPNTVLRTVLREHRVFLFLSLLYIVSGALVQAGLGRPWTLRVTTPWFAGVWGVASAILLLFRRGTVTPVRAGGACLVALLIVPLHLTFQSLKQSIGRVVGFPWDPLFSKIDVWLHGGPAWQLVPLVRDPLLLELLDPIYFSWVAVVAVWFTWISWLEDRQLRARALVATLILWVGAGTVGAWLLASAGPCYYSAIGATPAEPAYASHIEFLDKLRLMAIGAQQYVWAAYTDDRWVIFGGISAMPSMHVAMTTMMAIVLSVRGGWVAAVAWGYVVLIHVGSVALGWHYAIDGYVGAVLAWGCWIGAKRLARADVPVDAPYAAPPSTVLGTP